MKIVYKLLLTLLTLIFSLFTTLNAYEIVIDKTLKQENTHKRKQYA